MTVFEQRAIEMQIEKDRTIIDNTPTLRDQFAMSCLTGLQANTAPGVINWEPKQIAKYCYEMADEMLAARKEK